MGQLRDQRTAELDELVAKQLSASFDFGDRGVPGLLARDN